MVDTILSLSASNLHYAALHPRRMSRESDAIVFQALTGQQIEMLFVDRGCNHGLASDVADDTAGYDISVTEWIVIVDGVDTVETGQAEYRYLAICDQRAYADIFD
jgi:hypothetical protein